MIFYDDNFYPTPYQAIFLRPEGLIPTYEKGIVYKTFAISARDGKVFSIKKIYRYARKHGVDSDHAIVESFNWLPFEIS